MHVKGWSNGRGTYGMRINSKDKKLFDQDWTEIEVEIEGESHRFALTGSFWRACHEFRGRAIRDWLQRHRTLDWPKGFPPSMQLTPLGGNRFRLDS